jgi:hypothetical protein
VCANYADPSSKLNAGRSYVVFGKQDNTDVINLSVIAAGTGGFVINPQTHKTELRFVRLGEQISDYQKSVLSGQAPTKTGTFSGKSNLTFTLCLLLSAIG